MGSIFVWGFVVTSGWGRAECLLRDSCACVRFQSLCAAFAVLAKVYAGGKLEFDVPLLCERSSPAAWFAQCFLLSS